MPKATKSDIIWLDNGKARGAGNQARTNLLLGPPANPLNKEIVVRMIDNFKNIESIKEAYQYAQCRNKDFSIVIGIRLSNNSDKEQDAAIEAVQNALQGTNEPTTVDVLILDSNDIYDAVKAIENALFYSS